MCHFNTGNSTCTRIGCVDKVPESDPCLYCAAYVQKCEANGYDKEYCPQALCGSGLGNPGDWNADICWKEGAACVDRYCKR